MTQKLSEERKTTFYLGSGLMVLGGLLFLSTFITFALNFGNFDNFEANARSEMLRAVGGMILLGVGGFLRGLGARGLAGSGVVLDPEQARKDLEPYSRMAGGILKDALEETHLTAGDGPEKVIMIKCRACGQLNEEDSKFCQECGQKL